MASSGIFRPRVRRTVPLVVVAFGFLSSACTDREVIFRDRPFFEDPPPGAAGFLGYSDADAKLTVCGNCHVSFQGEWVETAHSEAWATLAGSGAARDFCEGCHSANPRGNVATGDGGWTATEDPRYHDVQCESCHGPGETHVASPVKGQMLAPLAVGVDLSFGCGECHTGVHQPFVEEWAQSAHAGVVSSAADNPACQSCHQGQGILRGWGVRANFLEKDGAEHLPITCGVCHDPHDAEFQGQLRFSASVPSLEENLCARCHNRRTEPGTGPRDLAPHAPEAPLLLGEAGWFPPGANIDPGEILGTHGSEANPRLCATCHMPRFTVTDRETGAFVLDATGHLFRPIPCLDEEGVPTADDTCPLTTEARSFAGCTESGCHGTATAARSALVTARDRIQQRADQLLAQLQQVDPNLDEPGGEIDPTDPTFTVAEGAFFNYNLATHRGGVLPAAAHNPFLIESLLLASMQEVEREYGVSPGIRVDYHAEIRAIRARAGD